MTITTTVETNQLERVANENKHLLQENEIIVVRNNYGQRKYKKLLNTLKLVL